MRLHVGVLRTKQFAGPVPRQVFHDIHVFAAAVVTFSRITLGIFVGQAGTHGCQHRRRNKILTGNQFHMGALAAQFQINGLRYFRIRLPDQIKLHFNIPPKNRITSV